MIVTVNSLRSEASRAVQYWIILVGRAKHDLRPIEYRKLERLGYGRSDMTGMGCGSVLGRIARYCRENNLPSLNLMAVSKTTGRPGHRAPAPINGLSMAEELQRIYDFDWYSIKVPTEDELPLWIEDEDEAA